MALSTDPIDLLLDANGDLMIADGDIVFSKGLDAVVQSVRLVLNQGRGEWFLDLDEGVPYLSNDDVTEDEALIGSKFDALRARRIFRDAVLGAPGVKELLSLAVTFDSATRKLTVECQVRTAFGDTEPIVVEVV